jgi:hypothetical protein
MATRGGGGGDGDGRVCLEGEPFGVDAVERPGEVVERRPAKSLHRSPRGATDLPEAPTRGTAPDSLSGTDHHGARLGWLRDTTPR